MATPTYRIFAIKYAHVGRKAWGNFVDGDPHEDWDMPLDYYVWAVVGDGRTIVVDTGFDAPMAKKRDRKIVHPVEQGLEAVGVRHADVKDVVITHMHYDHAGNIPLFPRARYHLQDKEMDFATGRCMCHAMMRHGYEADDVVHMVRCVFDQRVHVRRVGRGTRLEEVVAERDERVDRGARGLDQSVTSLLDPAGVALQLVDAREERVDPDEDAGCLPEHEGAPLREPLATAEQGRQLRLQRLAEPSPFGPELQHDPSAHGVHLGAGRFAHGFGIGWHGHSCLL